MFSFVSHNRLLVRKEIIDIGISLHQTLFLVSVNGEGFAASGGIVGKGLVFEVHGELGVRIFGHGVEDFGQEFGGHLNRQQAVVQGVVAEDVGKEAADHDTESVVVDGPSSVFARGAATEVIPCDEDGSFVVGVVIDRKVGDELVILGISPVSEEVVAESFSFGCLEESGGDNLVGIDIFDMDGDSRRDEFDKFFSCHGFV